ncbi:crotonase/enoyl-CoA hydratase family protein [Pseudomaricurvus alkylphenolicus]|uniref:crotonase/enoyl-CoA hydratase family protein n=1 Tax=Pseudomaricurvus alkylphenolicus TaxID=1306991 RepID=UPI00141F98CB|nr:crotonase/enoyl-CoA hydratase family protein [Pseudomaricurvus alkylphenolicus]NIB45156.1 crotonase/enoyl-CoA hydratase family protein [Pseudomaricurvus alkylphenolicus]
MPTCFNVEVNKGVARIHMNRPEKMNSMIKEFWIELPETMADLETGGDVRAVVISSEGKHFCCGMDLSVFTDGEGSNKDLEHGRERLNVRELILVLQKTFSCLDDARIPVLAACQGGVIGGAVDLVTACDMRYATEDAFFSIAEINLGMTADAGTFPRIAHVLPQGLAKELAYTGRRMYADEALRVGLVNQVYATQEELINGVMDIATEIASKSPLAVHGSKVMLNYARDHSIRDALDYISVWQAGMHRPETDMVEIFNAKAEKRAPEFQDLAPMSTQLFGAA